MNPMHRAARVRETLVKTVQTSVQDLLVQCAAFVEPRGSAPPGAAQHRPAGESLRLSIEPPTPTR